MELRFGLLADYAGEGRAGKLLMVGVFDTVYNQQGTNPVQIPPCYLVAAIDAHVTEGSEHRLDVHLTNEDGGAVIPPTAMPIKFASQGPGRPLRANVVLGMFGLMVPSEGTYAFNLLIQGRHLGDVPLYVRPAQPQS